MVAAWELVDEAPLEARALIADKGYDSQQLRASPAGRPGDNASHSATRNRQLTGSTVSDRGRDCRDGFLALMNTLDKLGVSFWDHLGDRLAFPDAPDVTPLPDLIRNRAPT